MQDPPRPRAPRGVLRAPFVVGPTLLSLLLAACGAWATGAGELPDRPFVGHLLTTEKGSWFRPCDAGPEDRLLWVTFTNESVRQIEAARSDGVALAGDTAFVRWRAAPTDEQMVGPGGPALLVRDIAEVRPADRLDCTSATRIPHRLHLSSPS